MRACMLALALLALAACEERRGGASAPALYLGGSLGAYGAYSR